MSRTWGEVTCRWNVTQRDAVQGGWGMMRQDHPVINLVQNPSCYSISCYFFDLITKTSNHEGAKTISQDPGSFRPNLLVSTVLPYLVLLK